MPNKRPRLDPLCYLGRQRYFVTEAADIDRVLRNDEATWDVVRYICENPVRKGLVQRWEEYEFTGSGIMTREQIGIELTSHPGSRWRP